MRYGDNFTDGKVTKEAILRLVNERRRSAEQDYQRFFNRTKSWYNIYRGISSGYTGARHDINVPILFSQIMSDVTNKAQAIFADPEVIQFVPNHSGEIEVARKNSNLVNIQLAESDTYLKAVDFFMSAAVYGTGIARTKWKLDRKTRLFRINVMGQEKIMPSVQTAFDGPDWEVVDILDFLPEPGKRRLQDCNWIIHTYYVDLDDLLEMQSGEGVPMFGQEAIMELLDQSMDNSARDAWKQRNTIYRTWTDHAARSQQQFNKPVRIDEYWGKVPSEFGIQGDRNLVITVANEKVVLRYEPNPFFDGELPFIIFTPMPDMHALHGTGKAEIAEKLQANINKLANIKMDALEIFGNPAFGVSDSAQIDGQTLVMSPGKLIKMNAEDVGKAFVPISPDLRALQMTYEEIQMLSGMQQQGVGIPNDVVQGMQSPDRETARGVLARKDAALGRLAGESMLAEHMMIVPLAQRYKSYNAQMLPLPKQIQIIGQDAIMDPATGLPVIGGDQQIGYSDLQYTHKCRALGAQRMMSKSILAQQMMSYAQIVSTNPAMAAMMNWVNFNKTICRALNLNPTELLIEQVQNPRIPLINQLAAQQGMDPSQMMQGMVQQQGMGQLTGGSVTPDAPQPMMGGNGSDTL